MPDAQRHGAEDRLQLEAMSDEELRQLLREDFDRPTGETDEILYIAGLLAARQEPGAEKTAAEAWETFQREYSPDPGEAKPAGEVPGARNGHRWMRAAAILVLAAVIAGGSLTARARGFRLWDIAVKWTQETFHLRYSTDAEESTAPLGENMQVTSELRSSLALYGIETALVPMWLPEGYTESFVKVQDTPKQRQFTAVYMNGEDMLRIHIADHLEDRPTEIEQSGVLLEVYSSNNINYYISDNYGQLRAAWIVDRYECCIMGAISQEELKLIIDSIGKESAT